MPLPDDLIHTEGIWHHPFQTFS